MVSTIVFNAQPLFAGDSPVDDHIFEMDDWVCLKQQDKKQLQPYKSSSQQTLWVDSKKMLTHHDH